MEQFKSGFVTIIGRPNVGKSTLLNNFIGEKLSIISNRPQTTRNTIQAIYHGDHMQVVFLDTPGMHKPRHKLGEYMVKVAQNTLREVDLVLFLTNPGDEVGVGDKYIIEQLRGIDTKVILVINKTDSFDREKVLHTIEAYSKEYPFDEVVPVSARTGDNTDTLMNLIASKLPIGPKYFPDDMITDVPEKFIISELIREKILYNLKDEIPHGTAVDILSLKEDKDQNTIEINATIFCEKDSHKAIIIGKGGQMLKKIGQQSRFDIEKLLGSHVYLELWVKVKKDWRDSVSILKNLGYQ